MLLETDTQVIPWELRWMSLFGENSRLIGPISSWVDVPGAEPNLIRRAAAAGLCGGGKAVPSSMVNRPEAKILLWRLLDMWKPCQPGTYTLTALCVHVHVLQWCECKNPKCTLLLFLRISRWVMQVQSGVVSFLQENHLQILFDNQDFCIDYSNRLKCNEGPRIPADRCAGLISSYRKHLMEALHFIFPAWIVGDCSVCSVTLRRVQLFLCFTSLLRSRLSLPIRSHFMSNH